jgi:23S rRNA-/tRNA-specific pseudouridylate synthase
MTSQPIDPTICSISLDKKEGKDTDVDVDTNESGNQGREKISYPMRVITSTLVARLIYIRKGTNISIEYVNCCTDDDNSKKKNNDRDHCCDKSWKWGLFLHRFVGWEVENSDDNNNNVNHNSNHANISDRQKQEKEMDIEMVDTKNISTASDDEIQLPEEKRARCSTRNTNQNQKQQQASSKIDKITKNNNSMVNFFPEEARKKPLLCSTCYKKFPTASAIYKHAIAWHLETIAKKGSQEYINLVGPPVVHKPLHAAYDDDDIVVVVKHQGLSVMGERWTLSKSDLLLPFRRLVNKPKDVPVKGKNGGKVIVNDTLSKPRAAHRLDSATGGLLVVAKTHTSEISMKKCFMNRTCQKRYRAILFGRLEGVSLQSSLSSSSQNILSNYDKISKDDTSLTTGIIDSPIGGKESMTYYSVVSYTRCSHVSAKGWITTVDLYPVTGRNHQLRKHMKLVGHPMWGDKRYGPYGKKDASFSQTEEANDTTTNVDLESMTATQNPHSKLCLWALEITFPHPIHGKELNVKIDEPNWYRELRDDQEKKWKCLQS